jgi:uncharacterized protein
MVRPRKTKNVDFEPEVTYFKPQSVPLRAMKEVELTVEELEALRLANIEKLSQEDAAVKMNVHQSTFQRTLTRACEKVTDALVNGKAIKIEGGNYKMVGRNRNFGRGRMGGPLSAGPGGNCKCPKCGHEQQHTRGKPCNTIKCPKCNTLMIRA